MKSTGNLGHTHEMLKNDPEVTKGYGWRDSIAFSEPQSNNFSENEKSHFPGKADSVLLIFTTSYTLYYVFSYIDNQSLKQHPSTLEAENLLIC